MQILIPILCLTTLVLAEPPVGEGYSSSHQHNDHNDHNDHHATEQQQRSLSQEYGLPETALSRNVGYDYNAPSSRSSLREKSQKAPVARVSFNQRFSSPAAKSDNAHLAPDSRSQEYSAPNSRNGISQEYGAPAARSLSQEYGAPASARALSTEYGAPNAKSSPSEEYGVPSVAARSNQTPHQSPASNFRNAQSSRTSQRQGHSMAAVRSKMHSESLSHGSTDITARFSEAQSNNLPNSEFASRSGSSSTFKSFPNNVPSVRSSSSKSVSKTYAAPSQRGLSESYGAPNARDLSQEYGVPTSHANQKISMTDAIASSYSASSRTAPSSTYLPASRDAMPAQQYGLPEQDNNQGYAQARALNELLNQEPASYDFAYQIEDNQSGSDFGHTETRQGNRAEGSYFVVRPDGTKQTVEYEADEDGFRPRISVEPAGGGYDENASDIDLARSSGGPY